MENNPTRSTYASCKPIAINGENHIVSVNKSTKEGTSTITISHHLRTLDGNKEIPSYTSVSFDAGFIKNVIQILNIYSKQLEMQYGE